MDLEEAVDRAIEFLERKAGFYIHRLLRAELRDGRWFLEFDVGVIDRRIVRLVIEDSTGKVIAYEGPSRA